VTTTSAHVYVPRSLSAAFRRRMDDIDGATYRLLIDDIQRYEWSSFVVFGHSPLPGHNPLC